MSTFSSAAVLIINACQRSCEKVMFSVMSLCPRGGSFPCPLAMVHWTSLYRAPWPWTQPLWTWDLTVQGPPSPTPWTWDLTVQPPLQTWDLTLQGPPHPPVVTFGGQDRRSVQTCIPEDPPPTPAMFSVVSVRLVFLGGGSPYDHCESVHLFTCNPQARLNQICSNMFTFSPNI